MIRTMLSKHKGNKKNGTKKYREEYLEKMMELADTNEDGVISRQEFYNFYKHRWTSFFLFRNKIRKEVPSFLWLSIFINFSSFLRIIQNYKPIIISFLQLFIKNMMKKVLLDKLVAFRRELHQYPEVSFKEFETHKRLKNMLLSFGVP